VTFFKPLEFHLGRSAGTVPPPAPPGPFPVAAGDWKKARAAAPSDGFATTGSSWDGR